MLTKNKYLLIGDYDYKIAKKLFNLEAIKIIYDADEVELTWKRNKTPLMLERYMDNQIRERYPCLKIPKLHVRSSEDFIAFCHKNGIECGEVIFDRIIDTSTEHCFLCHIAGHGGLANTTEFNRHTEKISDTVIYESKNFFVQIELGAMIKGMLMICPKRHILAAAHYSDKLYEEFRVVKIHMEWMLKEIYGDKPVIFFEHGSAPDGMSSHQRSIVHAHTHVAWGVPFPKKYLDTVCVRPVFDERVSPETKYFAYQEGTKGQMFLVNNPEVYIQRQYPRQVIGELVGVPNYKTNWRHEPFMENVVGTYEDFYTFLTTTPDIPDVIRERTRCFADGYQQGTDWRTAY